MTTTHTYATLDVSTATFVEIRDKLLAAGYADQISVDSGGTTIDMHGIALTNPGVPLRSDPGPNLFGPQTETPKGKNFGPEPVDEPETKDSRLSH